MAAEASAEPSDKRNGASAGHSLEDIICEIDAICGEVGEGRVTVAKVMKTLGHKSFGPLLLVPGLIGVSPIGAIPGLPAVMALIVLLVSGQILIGMDHAWLPGFLLRRSMSAEKLGRACRALRPYARYVDRFVSPRLTVLTKGPFFYLMAAQCFIVSIVTPVIEIVPLAGIVPNAAIVAFGLAITAHDGVWAILATVFTLGSFYLLLSLF